MTITEIRKKYHQRICHDIIRIVNKAESQGYPNNADGSNTASKKIAWQIIELIGYQYQPQEGNISDQTAGNLFELITKDFLQEAFELLAHLRPGRWIYAINTPISRFDQYKNLAEIETVVRSHPELAAMLGQDYIISPDITIAREPLSDEEINQPSILIDEHDRVAQLPHIVVVTAEPTPTRIASLALGTGDIDCVYHFALHELKDAIQAIGNEDQLDMLCMLIEGRRLRDISDLPFDLAA